MGDYDGPSKGKPVTLVVRHLPAKIENDFRRL
jgi:hypothetical protein